MDMDVHFNNMQTCHHFNGAFDVALNFGCDFGNLVSIFNNNGYVYRRLALTYFNLDTLGQVFAAQQLGDASCKTAAHAGYAIHFAGAAGYLGNHGAGTCIGEPSYQASLGVRVDRAAETETCASIEARYEQVLEEKASCEQPTDCRITAGHCGAGIGGCWYAVSGDVSELDTLAERYRDLGCTSVVCRCAAPPESASCVAGRCMAD